MSPEWGTGGFGATHTAGSVQDYRESLQTAREPNEGSAGMPFRLERPAVAGSVGNFQDQGAVGGASAAATSQGRDAPITPAKTGAIRTTSPVWGAWIMIPSPM